MDGENEPLPDFLLPEYSQKVKRSPLLNRATSPPPKIFTVSLKNMSGLEGVKTNHLTAQHSVEQGPSKRSLAAAPGREDILEAAESLAAARETEARERTSVSSSDIIKTQVSVLPSAKENK